MIKHFADLIACAKQIRPFGMSDHFAAHRILRGRNVGQFAVVGITAAGEKTNIRIVSLNGFACVFPHKRKAGIDHVAARTDAGNIVFAQFGQRAETVGNNDQIAFFGEIRNHTTGACGRVQKNHAVIGDKRGGFARDLSLFIGLFQFPHNKRHFDLRQSVFVQNGADVIETPWQLKPVKRHGFVDCHTHTRFSHDSVCDPAESVRFAKEKGVFGIAFTDHFDTEYEKNIDIVTPIRDSVNTAGTFRGYALSGIEIGEAVFHPDTANRIIASVSPDIVLCSVHAVRYKQYTMPYSQIDFSKFTEKEIGEYLAQYFDDLTEAAETSDCDVLSHLTCPLRYICGKYGISVDLHAYEEKTDCILKTIIQKGIALEVNTSGLGSDYDCLMPSAPIIKKYKEFGGTLITLASDAHKADRIAHGFPYAAKILRETGFGHIFYYKNRIPVAYAPEEWE